MFTPRVNLPEHLAVVAGRWIIVDNRQQVLIVNGTFPIDTEAPVRTKSTHLLGLDDGVPVWAGSGDSRAEIPDGGEWVNLRALFGQIPDAEWVLAGRASQVLIWERDHKFCGRCGAETIHHPMDRARQCESCRLLSFPRISPAVIMLVERDGDTGPEVLLAWGRQFPGRFFSALAGFVEPGESLEDCVIREVEEETSIKVDQVTYFGSQPWPFPHSMMVGFRARYVSGDIAIQEEEIVEAGWYGPDNLPPVPRGGMSIAGWLIDDWLERVSAN